MSELTHDDVRTILKIIDSIGDRDLRLEIGDLKLYVARGNAPADVVPSHLLTGPIAEATPVAVSQVAVSQTVEASLEPQAKSEIPAGQVAVRAPTMGTCYHAPSPGAEPFVKVGDHVEPNDVVCILDVMKLFSSLCAGMAGTVTAIMVENEALVEQDEPLILIRPD